MTNSIDYSTIDIPSDESPAEYHYTVRRAEILKRILQAGSPAGINQTELADRYDVTQGQISQDVDTLGEHVAESLGSRATLETRAAFERIRRELYDAGEWKQAWDVIMDWNDWLAKVGAQEHEPRRSELDVDMKSRHAEVAYQIVRGDDGEPESLPKTDSGDVDYEAIGFSAGPGSEGSDT